MRYQPGSHDPSSLDIVIAGGGIGGMAVALDLARAGHRVTLVEGDAVPHHADPEAAFTTRRQGAPQVRQTHGLLARLTNVLRQRFPDLLDELHDLGATEVSMVDAALAPRPGDDELHVLLVRRTTLEWVLRRAVLRQSGLTWRDGTSVVGLEAAPTADSRVPVVTGARLMDGSVLPADIVIAATGRRLRLSTWLSAVGVEVDETEHASNLMYLTRWYRVAEGATIAMSPKMTGNLGYLRYLAVPGDAGTFSVTLAVRRNDAEMRARLLRPDNFDGTAALLDGVGEAFTGDQLSPISDVEPMSGFVNRVRRFLDDEGRPKVLGFHAIGDAHTCTNPYYGRGCSLALVQAGLLADAITGEIDAANRSVAYETATAREVEPWFHHSVLMDTVFDSAADALAEPDDVDPGDIDRTDGDHQDPDRPDAGAGHTWDLADPTDVLKLVIAAGAQDPVIGRALLRVFNLLTRPDELTLDPDFAASVAKAMADPASIPPVPSVPGPTRAEILGGPAMAAR